MILSSNGCTKVKPAEALCNHYLWGFFSAKITSCGDVIPIVKTKKNLYDHVSLFTKRKKNKFLDKKLYN